MSQTRPHNIGIVLFDGFELLDVFGPAEVLANTPGLEVNYLSKHDSPVSSAQGVRIVPTMRFESFSGDTLLVPGGRGTRSLAQDPEFLRQLTALASSADIITSVCTGSALLAAAGLLENHTATTNKNAFDWVRTHGQKIEWKKQARWVHDGNLWTSSGVAAGIDMAVAFITHFFGEETALSVTNHIELIVNSNPDNDPFAV
ncbi:DJ-1/PfpI family protein [Corynebacterium sp. KPL2861]|uniref:DJ-1/PfpI family protein n=1 Tax=Corynebacterium sp. KPL2861 TaxID=3158319 RepID=UPI0032ECC13C